MAIGNLDTNVAAFGPVKFSIDSSADMETITVNWHEGTGSNPPTKSVSLTRPVIKGKATFDIRGILANILGAAPDSNPPSVTPTNGAVVVTKPAILSKHFDINGTPRQAINAVVSRGVPSFADDGFDGLLSERPRELSDDGPCQVKMPVFPGYPVSFCISYKSRYSGTQSFGLTIPSGNWRPGQWLRVQIKSNTAWRWVGEDEGFTCSQTHGFGDAEVYVFADRPGTFSLNFEYGGNFENDRSVNINFA